MGVMTLPPIDPERFIALVQPPLQVRDIQGLTALLKQHWTPEQIMGILSSDHTDARKVAALALSLVGGKCCIAPLATQLTDPDPMINEMVEHALWSIWFRCGTPEANMELARGTQAISDKDFRTAIGCFNRAIDLDPSFAEAYNQRAICFYLQDQHEESIVDCLKVVELMPCHFGAWAGMGHCHAHRGRIIQAIQSYQTALNINPHMTCVREAVQELQRRLRQG